MSSVGLGCRGVVISINGMQILDASENQKARAKVNVDKQAVMKQGGVAWLPLDQDGSQSVEVLRKVRRGANPLAYCAT